MLILKSNISTPGPITNPSCAHSRPRPKRATSLSLWKFSLPLITSRSQAPDCNSSLRHISPVHSTNHDSRSASPVDFDISYFYINRTPPRDPPPSPPTTQHLKQLAMHTHVDLALIPLAFAQARTDIRQRNEGFEMALVGERSAYAARTHGLIPLRDALNREDIRRRGEGFELAEAERRYARRRGGLYGGVAGMPGCTDDDLLEHTRASVVEPAEAAAPRLSTAFSDPSIYSAASWEGDSAELYDALGRQRSWISAEAVNFAEVDRERNPADGGRRQSGDGSQVVADLSDSFDEQSFLRMASTLGW